MRRVIVVGSTVLSIFLFLGAAAEARRGGHGSTRSDPDRGPHARRIPRASRSLGLPWRGRLDRGLRVESSTTIRKVGQYVADDRYFGTWQLIQLLERAAYRVDQLLPGAKLSIGELSAQRGGDVPGHSSHENGRDVDVAFYVTDARGRSIHLNTFINFQGDGRGDGGYQALRFDDHRNWELVRRLVADGDARVQYIFVSRPLRARLLAEGQRRNAPEVVLRRAAQVLMQPRGRHPHRNHFHVRIYCPPDSRPTCEDVAPYWPWYPGAAPIQAPPVLPPPTAVERSIDDQSMSRPSPDSALNP